MPGDPGMDGELLGGLGNDGALGGLGMLGAPDGGGGLLDLQPPRLTSRQTPRAAPRAALSAGFNGISKTISRYRRCNPSSIGARA